MAPKTPLISQNGPRDSLRRAMMLRRQEENAEKSLPPKEEIIVEVQKRTRIPSNTTPDRPTVGLCIGPYAGPMECAFFLSEVPFSL